LGRTSISLSDPGRIQLRQADGTIVYGADQEWYGTRMKRMAGCGPTVGATQLRYLQEKGKVRLPVAVRDQESFVVLMDRVWCHVTPNFKGVSTLPHYCGGMHSFLKKEVGTDVPCHTIGIPRKKEKRPTLDELAAFLAEGLAKDCPVAFLILTSGTVEHLEAWHWVTIVSIDHDPDAGSLTAEIYNARESHRIDLKQWLETPGHGGGFVYFD